MRLNDDDRVDFTPLFGSGHGDGGYGYGYGYGNSRGNGYGGGEDRGCGYGNSLCNGPNPATLLTALEAACD